MKGQVQAVGNCTCCACDGEKTTETTTLNRAATATQTLRIEGLDCADCAAKLEKGIGKLNGIQQAKINFAAGTLQVDYDARVVDIAAILQAIAGYGYNASAAAVQDTAGTLQTVWWRKPRMMATVISGLLLSVAAILSVMGLNDQIAVGFFALSMVVGGYHTVRSGLYALRTLTFDTNFLMVIAVVGAAAIGEWSEGATVVFLFSLGNALQSYTMDKTRESIRSLMKLAPREALVRRNGQEVRLPVETIEVGDIVVVKPGERIAMDGEVLAGLSSVNQAAITGESMPLAKREGDIVYAGTMNGEGALEITVTKLVQDSTLAKIMHMVEEAQTQKAPMQQYIDRFAKYYTPLVIVLAVGICVAPPLLFQQSLTTWFYRALVLLVISCPCALVISTPVSIVSAIGNASRNGVLIKGGAYLEQMGSINTIAFDKTGTLTMGRPVVTDIVPLGTVPRNKVLLLAAAVEKRSEHSIARAISEATGDMTIPLSTNFKALVGKGAQADIEGQRIFVGNLRLFAEYSQDLTHCRQVAEQLEQSGKTVILVGTEQAVYGMIAVADKVRDAGREAVAALKNSGVGNIVMLTGDNKRAAQAVADSLGVSQVYSELLPEDKVRLINELNKQYGSVAMVGDGVNDAPALALADIGIAMGVAGSDAALETADIALMSDDLNKLSYIRRLSRQTIAIIKQNITFSLLIKALFVVGTLGGFVNLWLAVFADTGATILVTLNGMRLVKQLD